ncbi:hypothetical protein l11_05440 [Neisseria weaveri LMG 5135]|nr:hypothetical protein l13_14220 [Neisseria weaveri ATCC 51223]EGV38220.1 hypothetical protein l11_05440 [Neisseria weaveri LMG 5135]
MLVGGRLKFSGGLYFVSLTCLTGVFYEVITGRAWRYLKFIFEKIMA